MKRKILIVLSLVLCIVVSLVAFAYPTVGSDPEITTTTTYNSGSFTNYHFPNRYITGDGGQYSIGYNSATQYGVATKIHKYSSSSGLATDWQYASYQGLNTSNAGPVNFNTVSGNYYCYKITKTTSDTININYTVTP